jgi:hypothetical protein
MRPFATLPPWPNTETSVKRIYRRTSGIAGPVFADQDAFPVTSLDDIIASKRATGREKDLNDLKRLEQLKREYTQRSRP